MKRLKQFGTAFAVVLLAAAGIAWAQNKLPVPSQIWSTGELVVAIDANNLGSPTDLTNYVTQMKSYTAELTPTVVAGNLCAEQTFTYTGVATTDKVFFNVDEELVAAATAAAPVSARPSGADTVAITFCNVGANESTPQSGTYNVIAIRG